MTFKIYTCKHCRHLYTVCDLCQGQYCAIYWKGICPRASWHPDHATTDEDRGRRARELAEARSLHRPIRRGIPV